MRFRSQAALLASLIVVGGCGTHPGTNRSESAATTDAAPVRPQPDFGAYRFVGAPIATVAPAIPGQGPSVSVYFRLDRALPRDANRYLSASGHLDRRAYSGEPIQALPARPGRHCYEENIDEGLSNTRTSPRAGQLSVYQLDIEGTANRPPVSSGRLTQRLRHKPQQPLRGGPPGVPDLGYIARMGCDKPSR